MSVVSQAKHQQNSSANNVITPLNGPEGKNEDVLEGPIGEVLAQSGSVAVLPCKITDPGAGTVSAVQFMPLCFMLYKNVTLARSHTSLSVQLEILCCLFVC